MFMCQNYHHITKRTRRRMIKKNYQSNLFESRERMTKTKTKKLNTHQTFTRKHIYCPEKQAKKNLFIKVSMHSNGETLGAGAAAVADLLFSFSSSTLRSEDVSFLFKETSSSFELNQSSLKPASVSSLNSLPAFLSSVSDKL